LQFQRQTFIQYLNKEPFLQRLFRHPGFRQFVKFCIVGGSSTLLDMAILSFLLHFLPHLFWWVSQSIAFAISVSNGFYWNRHWTFKARDFGKAHTQYSIFVTTNLVGLGINLFVMKTFLVILTGKLIHGPQNPDNTKVLIAYICAIPFGVVWNYLAAKHWTFRQPKHLQEQDNS
jgi:putative flippase GtrA